ncbi:MAG TPA: endonuclease/exonuclease/phosphatase family protein, partial [Bacteroidales bacterium]|nr:endonuclease/exonuclease/phosphatase family protein [Bacteroidales bacterium]
TLFRSMIRLKADSLCQTGTSNSKLIITGDFNATPGDPVMKNLISGQPRDNPFLFNLSEPLYQKGKGTYRYMGVWEMIDQFIVSEGLLKGESGLVTGYDAFGIFSPEFLLRDDPRYPGKAPWPTYRGYRYQGGYSDHLPVILDLYHD